MKNTTLSKYDMGLLFDVVEKDGKKLYNMSSGLYLNMGEGTPADAYDVYIVEERDTWPLISYKRYGTIELWWLVCKVNGVTSPFDELVVGSVIRLLNDGVVEYILNSIKSSE